MPLFGRSYSPPSIPVTPSKRINDLLHSRCNKYFHSLPKYALATFVCAVISLCVRVYNAALGDDRRPSRVKWTLACGVVAIILGVLTWYAVIFNTLYYVWVYVTGPAGSYLFYNLCDYGCLTLGVLGCVLATASVVIY